LLEAREADKNKDALKNYEKEKERLERI